MEKISSSAFGENYPKARTEKISPHSEKVLQKQKEVKERRTQKDLMCFGMSEFKEMEQEVAQRSEDHQKNQEVEDDFAEDDFGYHQDMLRSYYLDDLREDFLEMKKSQYTDEVFIEALANPDIAAQLERFLETGSVEQTDLQEATKVEQCFEALRTQRISAWLWRDIIENHQREFFKKREKVMACLSEFQQRLRSTVEVKIRAGDFPLSLEKYDLALGLLTFEVSDGIIETDERLGAYNQVLHEVILTLPDYSDPTWKEQLFEVFVHEVFHALSGKTVFQKTQAHSVPPREFTQIESYTPGRVGVRIYQRFRWLNEAVTETLTRDCSVNKESDFYEDECQLLEVIMTKYQIAFPVFLKAYFEDYEPGERETEEGAIAGWKELYTTINEKCGNGFLLQLDKDIKKRGVKAVLKDLKDA